MASYTGLMSAMSASSNKAVRILLGCTNIKIDIKDDVGYTALHYACINNNIEGVKLFLEHPTCNKDIVNTKDKWGRTAEMRADRNGNQECAKLVREYLENNDEETKLEHLTLSEVAKIIKDMNDNGTKIESKMKDDHEKEIEKLETEYKRKRDAIVEKHNVENKQFRDENEKMKIALCQELDKKLASFAGGAPGL